MYSSDVKAEFSIITHPLEIIYLMLKETFLINIINFQTSWL